jgi:hypothetical protein
VTRNQAHALLVICGLIGEVFIFFAVDSLGASHRMVILAVLVWMMVVCYMVGVIGVHYERREKMHQG